ncbi:MAG: Hsp70 family protein [Anaerolineae bacterium]|nr:Hsp70 family protein [Anaerolineae bacterium]
MRVLPHLESSVYVEAAQGVAVPLFGAGTPLPAVRRHTLPGPQSQQVNLALHIVHGSSTLASENDSLGKWLISRTPPVERASGHLRLQFTVDAAGTLELTAVQGKEQLAVTPLQDGTPRLPVDAASIQPGSLAGAWERVRAGEESQVREDLAALVQTQPDSVAAWALLAALVVDPQRKAGCYRQVLRLDPSNLAALAVLRSLSPAAPVATPSRSSGAKPRVAPPAQGEPVASSAELERIRPEGESQPAAPAQVEDEDAVIAELLSARPVQRPASTAPVTGGLFSRLTRRLSQGRAGQESPPSSPLHPVSDLQAAPGRDPLDPGLILKLAGGPLSADERLRCPECGATVSREQDKCPWCSASLS